MPNPCRIQWITPVCVLLTWFPALLGQDLPVPEYPPELVITPEPPAIECSLRFIGYAQPTQGVLQDDPFDLDLLKARKGMTAWRDILHPPEVQAGFQYPTFEALIDMAAARTTYLIGAKPYDRTRGLTSIDAIEHSQYYTFHYYSTYSGYSDVQCRVTILNNGQKVEQFITSGTYKLRNKGTCATYPPIGQQQEVLKIPALSNRKFRLNNPGNYLMRVELVYKGTPQDEITSLKPTGLAFDVIGRVVPTQTPSLLIVNAGPSDASDEEIGKMYTDARLLPLDDFMKDIFPVADQNQTAAAVDVSRHYLGVDQFDDFLHMAHAFALARRFSLLTPYDRTILVMEKGMFNTFQNSVPSHPVFSCFAGVNMGKSFIAVPGRDFRADYQLPESFTTARNILHQMVHTLGPSPWAPIAGKMGDCKVMPYHGDLNVGKLALMVRLKGAYAPAIIPRRYDLMQRDVIDFFPNPLEQQVFASQCSYRRVLEALSKPQIDPPVVMVSGVASRIGPLSFDAELNPLYQTSGYYELTGLGTGDYHILLKDKNDLVLGDYPFDPGFQYAGTFEERIPFNFTVPNLPGLHRVEVTGPVLAIGGTYQAVLDAIDSSPFPPLIWDFQIQATMDGDHIRWSGFDFDGGPLFYSLLVSEDGELFLPTEIAERQVTSTTMALPASISHLKLIVSDGSQSSQKTLLR